MTSIKVRAIKPAKMKLDNVRKEIVIGLRKEGKALKADFEKTTSSWTGDKPEFNPTISTERVLKVEIGPTGNQKGIDKWNWLNSGTKAHAIVPRNARFLRFKGGFKAKTKVRKLQSGPGKQGSGPDIVRSRVRHPGIRPRKWITIIGKNSASRFQDTMRQAIKRGADGLY